MANLLSVEHDNQMLSAAAKNGRDMQKLVGNLPAILPQLKDQL